MFVFLFTGNLSDANLNIYGINFLRLKDLGVSVLGRSVTGTVPVCIYHKFPLFLHVDDEEQSNDKDSVTKETRGNKFYLNT